MQELNSFFVSSVFVSEEYSSKMTVDWQYKSLNKHYNFRNEHILFRFSDILNILFTWLES